MSRLQVKIREENYDRALKSCKRDIAGSSVPVFMHTQPLKNISSSGYITFTDIYTIVKPTCIVVGKNAGIERDIL